MKKYLLLIPVFCFYGECFGQGELFERSLRLEKCSRYGRLWGNENKRWAFDIKYESGLKDKVWEHVLPKSVLTVDKIVISRNELDYFLNRDKIKVQSASAAIANPPHWQSRFGKQIQTITFDKPLNVLIIRKNKLVKATINRWLAWSTTRHILVEILKFLM